MTEAIAMRGDDYRSYSFAEFTLDLHRGVLQQGSEDIKLRPQSFEVLCCLVRHHGTLVSKQQLFDTVWHGSVVTDDSLTQCLIDIRKAIGDVSRTMIRTVPARGFRFDLPVSVQAEPTAVEETASGSRRSVVRRRWSALVVFLLVIGATVFARYVADREAENFAAPGSGTVRDSSSSNAQAREFLLQGEYFYHRGGDESRDKARLYFQQALNLDPDLARAWVGLSAIYYNKSLLQDAMPNEWLEHARDAIERALTLDPDSPEAHIRAAGIYRCFGDRAASESHNQAARRLGPNNPLVLAIAAGESVLRGDLDEAVLLQAKGVTLDPLAPVARFNLANYLLAAGQFDKAEEQWRKAVELGGHTGSGVETSKFIASILILQNQADNALKNIEQWRPGDDKTQYLALAYHSLGRTLDAQREIRKLSKSKDSATTVRLAELYAHMGDLRAAGSLLDQSLPVLAAMDSIAEVRKRLIDINFSPYFVSLREQSGWNDRWLKFQSLVSGKVISRGNDFASDGQ